MALLSGCAVSTVLVPLAAVNTQALPLNPSLKSVTVGMNHDQAHKLMGKEMLIGYDYSGPQAAIPITVPNPYKTEEIRTSDGIYTVEYYVSAVHQPDGVVSNDELTPLVFRNGILAGKGWEFLNRNKLK